jgi:hypothetical protein
MSFRCRLAGVAGSFLAAWGAATADAAVRNTALQILGLRSPDVEVRLVRDADDANRRTGTVALLVRNRATGRRLVRIRYAGAGARAAFTVRGKPRSPSLRGAASLEPKGLARPKGLRVRLGGRELLDVAITLRAREAAATPEEADGRLIVTAERPGGGGVVGRPLVLRLRGVRAEERLVTVSPKAVTLPLTLDRPASVRLPFQRPESITTLLTPWRLQWRSPLEIDPRRHGVAYVDLRGPGAAALGNRRLTMVLRRADGMSVKATVQAVTGSDNVAQLSIPPVRPRGEVEIDESGRYRGTLPLGSGAEAPTIALAVEAREWWGWAAVAVLLGVLLGRMMPPFLRRERIRRRGRTAIADAIRTYGAARRGRPDPASYDLDWLIAPARWQLRGVLSRPHDEPARLLREIGEERDEKKLEGYVSAARTLRARVDRWAPVEATARRLLDVLDSRRAKKPRNRQPAAAAGAAPEAPPPAAAALLSGDRPRPRAATGQWWFEDTKAADDARAVLATLKEPPLLKVEARPSADEVRELGARCVRAHREEHIVALALRVWRRQERLDGRTFAPPENGAEWTDPHATRKQLELDAIWRKAGIEPDDAKTRDAAQFSDLARRLTKAADELAGLERTVSTRGGGAGVRQVAGAVAWGMRSTARSVVHTLERVLDRAARCVVVAWRRITAAVGGWFAVAEGVSLLLTLSVPVLIYVLTLYGDTWGSALDVLTAFGVGFAGKVALDIGTSVTLPRPPWNRDGRGGDQTRRRADRDASQATENGSREDGKKDPSQPREPQAHGTPN